MANDKYQGTTRSGWRRKPYFATLDVWLVEENEGRGLTFLTTMLWLSQYRTAVVLPRVSWFANLMLAIEARTPSLLSRVSYSTAAVPAGVLVVPCILYRGP